MHLLSGVAKQFWKLLGSEFGKKNNLFFLKPRVLKEIREAIAKSKRTTPLVLDVCITNLSKKTRLKSIEWINILCFIVPIIIIEHIKDQARDASIALSRICSIVFQKTITSSELWKLDTYIWCWAGDSCKACRPWTYQQENIYH